MPGDDGEEEPPVPMPNTEVKLFSADGNGGLSPCERRTLPGLHNGGLAQLGEHLPYKQRVAGSSPASSIHAGLAQLVEQLNRNQRVGGSSPLAGTIGIHANYVK